MTLPSPTLPILNYQDTRPQIQDGDAAFYLSDGSILNRLIARGQRKNRPPDVPEDWWGLYSRLVHVGMLRRMGDPERVWLLHTLIRRGAEAVLFSNQVAASPGHWYWFSVNAGRHPGYNRAGAVAWMEDLTGRSYGLRSLCSMALRCVPGLNRVFPPDTDDTHIDSRPPFCSAAVSLADRLGGGVDPVPGRADDFTMPATLAASTLRTPRGALVVGAGAG